MQRVELETDAKCLYCGKLMDCTCATGDKRLVPVPGDFTICYYCATLMVFKDGQFNLRLPTPKEMDKLKESGQLQDIELLQKKVRSRL